MGIVYVLENKINSKKYVGQTRQAFERRWQQHKEHLGHVCNKIKYHKTAGGYHWMFYRGGDN